MMSIPVRASLMAANDLGRSRGLLVLSVVQLRGAPVYVFYRGKIPVAKTVSHDQLVPKMRRLIEAFS
jgi:hypothetical protein